LSALVTDEPMMREPRRASHNPGRYQCSSTTAETLSCVS
jgi:hypothetical protein